MSIASVYHKTLLCCVVTSQRLAMTSYITLYVTSVTLTLV